MEGNEEKEWGSCQVFHKTPSAQLKARSLHDNISYTVKKNQYEVLII